MTDFDPTSGPSATPLFASEPAPAFDRPGDLSRWLTAVLELPSDALPLAREVTE